MINVQIMTMQWGCWISFPPNIYHRVSSLGVLFSSLIWARRIKDRAEVLLNEGQVSSLRQQYKTLERRELLAFVVFLAIVIPIFYFYMPYKRYINIGILVFFLGYHIVLTAYYRQKFMRQNLPDSYIAQYTQSMIVKTGGMLVFMLIRLVGDV